MGNEKEKTLDEKDIQFFQEQLKKAHEEIDWYSSQYHLMKQKYERVEHILNAIGVIIINSSDKKLEEEK
jgi:hypothetical protein